MKKDIYSYSKKDNGDFGIYINDDEVKDYLFSVKEENIAFIIVDELNICAGQQYAIGYVDGYIDSNKHK